MYVIFKNNKRASRKVFPSYELARQYVRKLIRKHDEAENVFWRLFTTNPPIGEYGYTIKAH